jgi:5-methylcytosine-specific restriction endonuclease McrA
MSSVLVLNATYEPLNVISLRRAIVLLLKDKAEVLESTDQRIHSAGLSVPVPLVIRLVYFVHVPSKVDIPLSRRTVMLRDNYTCQYCGAQPAKSNLTIDHVIPRVRKGATNWENVVCACKPCNQHKGSRLLEEVGMRLLSRPGRPRYVAIVLLSYGTPHETWHKYIPGITNERR